MKPKFRTIIINSDSDIDLSEYPNIHISGSILGMKKLYWGGDAMCIKKGYYIYNVSSNPDLYNRLAGLK
jgi:hypothetical protein